MAGRNVAVFLDRDGTINYDPGYLGDPDKVKLLPGVGEGIAKLKKEIGAKIIVISNQSGITRGLISDSDVQAVNSKINELLKKYGTEIDAFYYCPYHPEFDSPEKTKCRKPSPEMILKAANDFDIDLAKSYMMGDMITDVEAGINAGTKTVLLTFNKEESENLTLQNKSIIPTFVAANFLDACKFIIEDFLRRNN